jgi:hypothetical protein
MGSTRFIINIPVTTVKGDIYTIGEIINQLTEAGFIHVELIRG